MLVWVLQEVEIADRTGVMTAASFWSLLEPALGLESVLFPEHAWIIVAFGFLVGATFVQVADWYISTDVLSELSTASKVLRLTSENR
jgi:zinc transporter ZupT